VRIAEISVHSCPRRPLGSGDVGGMNLYILSISRELSKVGAQVDIFTRWHDPDEPEILIIDERTRLIHIRAGEPRDTNNIDVFNYLPEFQANLLAFMKKDGSKYDILHSHYWTSALVAEQLKEQLEVPNIVTFHTLGEVKNRAFGTEVEPELRIQSEKEIVTTVDCIIAFTPEERDHLVHLYGSQPEKIRVIPGGVDLDCFHPIDREQARRELHLEDYRRVLLFAGRLQPYKGLDLLLSAMTHLPNGRSVRLLVVGGNSGKADELAKLNSLVGELGINNKVSFVGAVEHDRMPIFYNAADICVIPSYHESFGLVAVEALASGTPVVASRVGGLATIVKDGETGYLFDERSPETLAMYLCLLMLENEIRESMAKAARSSVMKYDWSLTSHLVLRVFQELLGNLPNNDSELGDNLLRSPNY
jgi:D-inositol-3-phosphate glycosyltransferase